MVQRPARWVLGIRPPRKELEALPAHTLSLSVSTELQNAVPLVAVEADDGFVKAALGFKIRVGRERVVDSGRPAFFLKHAEDELLVGGRRLVFLDNELAESEAVQVLVPDRLMRFCEQARCAIAVTVAVRPLHVGCLRVIQRRLTC